MLNYILMCCEVAQVSDKKLLSLVTLRESLFEEVWDCCSQKHSSSPSIAERGWVSAEFCLLLPQLLASSGVGGGGSGQAANVLE